MTIARSQPTIPPDVYTVLSFYALGPPQVLQIDPLANAGGWSGSMLWRVTDVARNVFCLRRWPTEHPSEDRLRLIHHVLKMVAVGLPIVACPLPTTLGETAVRHGGHFWELTRWLPGVADYHTRPTPGKLRAALHSLAKFHDLAKCNKTITRSSPTLQDRLRRLELLKNDRLKIIQLSLFPPLGNAIDHHAQRLLAALRRAAAQLTVAESLAVVGPLPLQPVIRDIHHDHVLFTGDEVTGLIDFGALQIDTPLTDIARLVGSLAGDDRRDWQVALDAYSELRPLSQADRNLVELLDESGLIVAAIHWLTWLYVERRDMGPPEPIVKRLDVLLARLEKRFGEGIGPVGNGLCAVP